MIEMINIDKRFGKVQALSSLDLHVEKGSIYGLIGMNGAGKTTVLKHITGVLRADGGDIRIEGEPVYENMKIKERTAFIPDELYFFGAYNLRETARFYSRVYPRWDEELYKHLTAQFGLDEKRRLNGFSKGMQKQAAFILSMSAAPDYLILDEPIDGLDPLARKLVWKAIVDGVAQRRMTTLVSSHNLREMEGICDAIGILSQGKMLIERDLDELKSDIHTIQVAFAGDLPAEDRYEGLNLLHRESRGVVDLLIVRNPRETVETVIRRHTPLVFDILPLSLEEIFIYEMGGDDDAISSILF